KDSEQGHGFGIHPQFSVRERSSRAASRLVPLNHCNLRCCDTIVRAGATGRGREGRCQKEEAKTSFTANAQLVTRCWCCGRAFIRALDRPQPGSSSAESAYALVQRFERERHELRSGPASQNAERASCRANNPAQAYAELQFDYPLDHSGDFAAEARRTRW